jgi:AmiR/NasT family two-component response regulator
VDEEVERLRRLLEVRDQRVRELEAQLDARSTELWNANVAIESRDVIGMAKGILIGSLGCTPDRAFEILAGQSSVEHRKLYEIALEIVERNQRKPPES